MLTGPGERVSKGQDLMRVLDCSHPLVSANVDESVYNRLKVGGRATFRPSQGGGRQYDGVIVNLTDGRRRFREFRHTSRGDAQELVLRDRRRQRHERGQLLGRTNGNRDFRDGRRRASGRRYAPAPQALGTVARSASIWRILVVRRTSAMSPEAVASCNGVGDWDGPQGVHYERCRSRS